MKHLGIQLHFKIVPICFESLLLNEDRSYKLVKQKS
jgi:hypothetical protein